MEEEAIATTTYWCHMCSRTVNPLMEAEIKCPFCASGFIEEMSDEEEEDQDSSDQRPNSNSLLPPILMQLMNDIDQSVDDHLNENEAGNDLDSQLQAILRRRRERPSASIVQLLQGVRAASTLEHGVDDDDSERGRLVQIIAVPSSVSAASSSLSDYFIGPDFEALLQHLAENDPNRHGTPPARKDAVEALACVIIQEASLQCSVCLDDFEIGKETKEMPCKHKFHGECLLPWLELHSSCPVCRYQLSSDETKTDSAEPNGNDGGSESSSTSSSQGSENNHPEEEDDGGEGSGWLFRSFFSSNDTN